MGLFRVFIVESSAVLISGIGLDGWISAWGYFMSILANLVNLAKVANLAILAILAFMVGYLGYHGHHGKIVSFQKKVWGNCSKKGGGDPTPRLMQVFP